MHDQQRFSQIGDLLWQIMLRQVIQKLFFDEERPPTELYRRHAVPFDLSAVTFKHAPPDKIVEIDNAGELFLQAKHPKSFVSLDKADHLLSREQDSRYAGQVIAAWASRYLPATDSASVGLQSDGIETVARTTAAGFRTEIVTGGHPLIADEPAKYGGTNDGPSPYDLLSSALASCTTMTLRLYAMRKKLDLKSATVRVNHAKIHAVDCEDCETSDGKIDEFQRALSIEGNLTSLCSVRWTGHLSAISSRRCRSSGVKFPSMLSALCGAWSS